jgi:predicted ATP-dependent protease
MKVRTSCWKEITVGEAIYKYNVQDSYYTTHSFTYATLSSTPSNKPDLYQQMAEDSENQSITSEYLQNLMMEEINDPMVARVEAKMQARIEAKLQAQAGSSSNSRRYIYRDHEAGHAKLVAEYFA